LRRCREACLQIVRNLFENKQKITQMTSYALSFRELVQACSDVAFVTAETQLVARVLPGIAISTTTTTAAPVILGVDSHVRFTVVQVTPPAVAATGRHPQHSNEGHDDVVTSKSNSIQARSLSSTLSEERTTEPLVAAEASALVAAFDSERVIEVVFDDSGDDGMDNGSTHGARGGDFAQVDERQVNGAACTAALVALAHIQLRRANARDSNARLETPSPPRETSLGEGAEQKDAESVVVALAMTAIESSGATGYIVLRKIRESPCGINDEESSGRSGCLDVGDVLVPALPLGADKGLADIKTTTHNGVLTFHESLQDALRLHLPSYRALEWSAFGLH
jgi:hypothetical protein